MSNTIQEGKTTAIISHLWLVGLVIAYIMNMNKRNAYASFYIRQTIGLNLLQALNSIIVYKYVNSFAGFVFGGVIFVFWIISFLGAVQDDYKKIPVLGDQFQEWFAKPIKPNILSFQFPKDNNLSNEFEGLNFLVREPLTKTEQPPLLVMLHGYGSNEKDLFSFSSHLAKELLIISVQAPYSMGFDGFAWFSIDMNPVDGKFSNIEEAKQSIEKVAKLLDKLKSEYNTNPNKTFLLGFSQGSIISYALSFHYPNKVNHVVALSGYINEDLNPNTIPNTITTDYYISHGTVDEVLPVDWARKSA